MPISNNIADAALVFEGGGMRAAHTSGVIWSLLGHGLHFDFAAGISAGASCTVNYLSRDAERAKASFVDFAADPSFGSLASFLRGDGWFNAPYIYEQTAGPDQALPFDFDTFAANPARRRIGAFEADTGRGLYWTEDDMTTLPALMRRVRASSTMPILMPPTEIGGHTYVDGALGASGGIPLDAAQEAGYERFFVVLTQPRDYVKRPNRAPWLHKAWFRRFPAVADALNSRWRRYNATRAELLDLEADGKAILVFPEQMSLTNHTTDVPALQAGFEAGRALAERDLPRWRDWLGV
ncbi:MAG: patatin family protein [Propionibacteriaceae bacterium]|nr:patatin family protein [Propionibacteriaceae bacterium]